MFVDAQTYMHGIHPSSEFRETIGMFQFKKCFEYTANVIQKHVYRRQ
jgi:hypothetical protein